GADASNALRNIENLPGYLAGHQVGLIACGAGDEHVGIVGAGGLEHGYVRAAAGDDPKVQPFLQLGQQSRVGVDDRNVILLGHQVLGHAGAHLSSAQNDDFQSAAPVGGPAAFVDVDSQLLELAVQVGA